MWEIRSHILSPLNKNVSSEVKFKWTKIEQDYFEEIKRILDHNNLLTYPYINE